MYQTCFSPSVTFPATCKQRSLLTITLTVSLFFVGGQEYCGADDDVHVQDNALALLARRCGACHGSEQAESRLRLDRPEAILRGGDSGEPIVVPGDSKRSHLLERITTGDSQQRMPPDEPPLPEAEVRLLQDWIDREQNWTAAQAAISEEKSELWSFQPLTRPTVPAIDLPNPIDAFVQRKLQAVGLRHSPPASKRHKLRRLFLTMHGMPPTPRQIQEFLQDDRSDAWTRVVNSVLNSPRYGERLAMFWLDLIRFAETDGFETNRERPHAWHFRDWVIDAFNQDMPYDEFVRHQIAGDAYDDHVATGFLVAGPHDIVKGQDRLLGLVQRQDELDGIINATSATFLGLTVGCARCHNHKFDPVLQSDYYSLQAVFAGVTYANRTLPPRRPDSVATRRLEERINALRTQLAPYVTKTSASDKSQLRPAVNAMLNEEQLAPVEARFVRFNIQSTVGSQPCIDELEVFSGERNVALATFGTVASSSGDFQHPLHRLEHINDGRYGNSRSWIASQSNDVWVQLEFPKTVSIDRILWARDREGKYSDRLPEHYAIDVSTDGERWTTVSTSETRQASTSIAKNDEIPLNLEQASPEETAIALEARDQLRQLLALRRTQTQSRQVWAGTFAQPAATHRLYRGDPTAPRETVPPAAIRALNPFRLDSTAAEQERRVALADWIVDNSNPLTARVMVNRIWQHHFGRGIVDTSSDFGSNGVPPTHPQLLDWLAVEFMEQGWSIRRLHKQILLSATWQQSSQPNRAALAVDSATSLLWRYPPRRLEAEAIRDSVLAVSGQLRSDGIGGPGFSAFEVDLENVRHYFPRKSYGPTEWRRMIYMTRVRQERDAVFGPFDCPDSSQLVARRTRSTTPLQAMGLLNSGFMLQQARLFADRLNSSASSAQDRINYGWNLCFGRDPSNNESQAALTLIQQSGWTELCRALLNTNEFVFIP